MARRRRASQSHDDRTTAQRRRESVARRQHDDGASRLRNDGATTAQRRRDNHDYHGHGHDEAAGDEAAAEGRAVGTAVTVQEWRQRGNSDSAGMVTAGMMTAAMGMLLWKHASETLPPSSSAILACTSSSETLTIDLIRFKYDANSARYEDRTRGGYTSFRNKFHLMLFGELTDGVSSHRFLTVYEAAKPDSLFPLSDHIEPVHDAFELPPTRRHIQPRPRALG
ncbi:hypothetical protein EDB84DRAFT_1582846 [Lactarius hengduanensis]|nr:hypothetical protein EDB84DRAFT_1582846 [Lactarius hengduanensis]